MNLRVSRKLETSLTEGLEIVLHDTGSARSCVDGGLNSGHCEK